MSGRLLHYSKLPLVSVHSVDQGDKGAGCYKPRGLWISVEGEDDWATWCKSESFGAPFDYIAEIVLRTEHQVLWLRGAYEIDAFTAEYHGGTRYEPIDWPKVAERYHGLIIAPYCWARRMTDHTFWYYGWDCASGVIWNADSVLAVIAAQGIEARQGEDPSSGLHPKDESPVAEGDAP